jgi:hypothetical protein
LLDSFTAVQLARASLPCGGAGGAITMPRNTAHERLEKLAREARDPKGRKMIEDLVTNFGQKPKPDYTNQFARAFAADLALTLDSPWPDDPYIKKAFEKFDLDPLNPFNWRELLGYFARDHFRPGTGGRRKGTKKWDNNRLFGLSRSVRREGRSPERRQAL